jgi:hypothetical protein
MSAPACGAAEKVVKEQKNNSRARLGLTAVDLAERKTRQAEMKIASWRAGNVWFSTLLARSEPAGRR